MTPIQLSPAILAKYPDIQLGCIECKVRVEAGSDALWEEIDLWCRKMETGMEVADVNQQPAIAGTRAAYKALGKEPSRYRPSAEALSRRVVKGKGLYRVHNVVDLLNLVSLKSGYSIGGWDADRIEGTARLDIGTDAPYAAIGRGDLNIEFLPAFFDARGAFGTPTSDSERTMVRPETTRFLMVIYAFGHAAGLEAAMAEGLRLLQAHGHATDIEHQIITPDT